MDIWGVYQYIHVRLHEQKKGDFSETGKARASFSHVPSVASRCETETHLASQKQTKSCLRIIETIGSYLLIFLHQMLWQDYSEFRAGGQIQLHNFI
jgi:hypothetical protein